MSNLTGWPLRAISAIAITIFAFQGCKGPSQKGQLQPSTVPVVSPRLIDTVYAKDYVAEIQALKNVEIRSRVTGFLEQIHVDEGQAVSAGQMLFTISSRQFRVDLQRAEASLLSARADYKVARVELENATLLVDKGVVGQSQLAMAKAKADAALGHIEEANAAVALARLHLDLTQVRSPFKGVINRIPNKTGSLIQEGTLLTSIADDKEVFAYFNVTEAEYLDINARQVQGRQPAKLILANGKVHPEEGTVETVENQIDKETGSLTFRARFNNPDRRLRHGSSGKVSIERRLKQVLMLPQKCVFEIQDRYFVFTVGFGDTVHLTQVVPSLRLEYSYVIGSGLKPSDRVIYEGIQNVHEGDKVIPKPVEGIANSPHAGSTPPQAVRHPKGQAKEQVL